MNKKDLRLVIADDHPLLLKGLQDELEANHYNIVACASDGGEALENIMSHKPDMALLDINMPLLTGFEVVKEAIAKGTETKFIILSFHDESDYIAQALSIGVKGYLLKEDSFQEIDRCIDTVMRGGEYLSNSLDNSILRSTSESLASLKFLTPSELTILKQIADRKTTHEIAESLSISRRTVEKHRSNIISKLTIPKGTNSLTHWALMNKAFILDF